MLDFLAGRFDPVAPGRHPGDYEILVSFRVAHSSHVFAFPDRTVISVLLHRRVRLELFVAVGALFGHGTQSRRGRLLLLLVLLLVFALLWLLFFRVIVSLLLDGRSAAF